MLIDSRNLPKDEVIKTEVCIVGTGPAGMTLAREFLGQDFRVCLLESGDLEFNQQTQSLCEGETVGDNFAELHEIRRRQYGGLAHAWCIDINNKQIGLRHVPLDEIDFEKRDGLPYSGWPFDKSYLNPFYERAQSVCKLGPFTYEAQAWEDTESPKLPLSSERVSTSMFQFGPRDIFINEYRQEINSSTNITTYLNANVVEIETDETAKTVTRVRVACLQGNQFWVSAKIFILATGGIENARLLLLSNQTQKTGLGNQNDLVGRFFMDHPLILSGILFPHNRKIFNSTALYDLRLVNNIPVMGKLTLAQEVIRREKLLNMSALIFPRHKEFRTAGEKSLKTLLAATRRGEIPQDISKHLKNVIQDIDSLFVHWYKYHFKKQPLFPNLNQGGWSYLKGNEKKFTMFEVVSQTEQAPNPDNRVTLSRQLDKLGCPKAQLHWRWTQTDLSSIRRSQTIFAQEIARAGLGQLNIEQDGELPEVLSISTHHNMGTTRMHNDPKQGVVDANCQVHGVSNLFIAGSSVFPTGGYANPTLTIIALAIRLADHVKTHIR
ncbi:GMC family oxidoreductase [Brasilonema sp. UFV-L1]|uniref:GMC oxidoreductase n=1 Tax=Brasilonema sp. UFV-L1 TaxID=2234130 RepID=UPI00145E2031|nr:GMC family oxidoreductase [Brasilonema sp. UFV-L1]NMG06917.1 GMC family oxidoreductase [Brasilonema sp. UFV-L1]